MATATIACRHANAVEAARSEPVEVQFNEAAQIILAFLLGSAALLRALAVFLPVWRDKGNNSSFSADRPGQIESAASNTRALSRR